MFRTVVVALLALLVLVLVVAFPEAPAPVGSGSVVPAPGGVRLDLSNEGEDVLGCLAGLGYLPVPGLSGRLPEGPGALVVLASDRALCGSLV